MLANSAKNLLWAFAGILILKSKCQKNCTGRLRQHNEKWKIRQGDYRDSRELRFRRILEGGGCFSFHSLCRPYTVATTTHETHHTDAHGCAGHTHGRVKEVHCLRLRPEKIPTFQLRLAIKKQDHKKRSFLRFNSHLKGRVNALYYK